MEVDLVFTGVPVRSLDAGRDFFERLFGRPADVEVAVDEVMWRVAETAWLYVVVDVARAGDGLVALSVADLDATLDELAAGASDRTGWRRSGEGARQSCSTRTATRWRSFPCPRSSDPD